MAAANNGIKRLRSDHIVHQFDTDDNGKIDEGQFLVELANFGQLFNAMYIVKSNYLQVSKGLVVLADEVQNVQLCVEILVVRMFEVNLARPPQEIEEAGIALFDVGSLIIFHLLDVLLQMSTVALLLFLVFLDHIFVEVLIDFFQTNLVF